MKGPVERVPLLDVKLTFVELLEAAQKKHDINMVHLCVSVLEYMKDAQRWQFFMQNGPVLNDVSEMTSVELLKFVNEKLGIK